MKDIAELEIYLEWKQYYLGLQGEDLEIQSRREKMLQSNKFGLISKIEVPQVSPYK
jgi:hypothetical protein